ncbi:hypothetical protein BVRB_4g093730 [Beta vulgaris subsp. vulgaris]|nr:hypothetical protein BVRB_4g093730 [Beta vulgaris subsp. vulgaris]
MVVDDILTQALQSLGVDMSQANISIRIDLAKQANQSLVSGISTTERNTCILFLLKEMELAVAANKLAECQKTIASLGNQLKSLATLEDIFLESEKLLEVPKKSQRFYIMI